MIKRTDCSNVCSTEWVCGTTSDYKMLKVDIFRPMGKYPKRKYLYSSMNDQVYSIEGMSWKERDELQKKIDDEALLRGYACRYYSRPTVFIQMKLPPRVRKEASRILMSQGSLRMYDFVSRVCKNKPMSYSDSALLEYIECPDRRRRLAKVA